MAACSTASSTAAAVPVVQLHVAVVAVSQQLVWPLQQLLAVLQEADNPSPWRGCMGKRVTLKYYPCSSSNTKRKMPFQKNRKRQKKRREKQQISVSVNAFAIGGTFEVRSHSMLLLIVYRDFKGSGA